MKLKNDWWGYSERYGWAVMLEIVDGYRDGGDAVFYSFKTNDEFDIPFRDLESHDITFALRHFKTLPAQEQVLAKEEFEKHKRAWPSVQAKRIADKNIAIELIKQERESKKTRLEQDARDAEIERKVKNEEAILREQESRNKIKTDRAISAMTLLTENEINYLWHFTSIDNLPLILGSGCLYSKSKNPNVDNVKFVSDDLSRKLDQSLRRDHFVRLSFIPNSWYFHRVCTLHRLIWLRFPIDCLKSGVVRYAKGNAASGRAQVCEELLKLELDWRIMKGFQSTYSDDVGPRLYPSSYPRDGDDPAVFQEEKDIWNSEVMIENSLLISYCDGVYDARTGAKIQIHR